MASAEMVVLESKDGEKYEVPRESLRLSNFFRRLPYVDDIIRTDDVDGLELSQIAVYMNHYAFEDPVDLQVVANRGKPGIEPDEFEMSITAWDTEFLASMNDVLIKHVCHAASMLEMEQLYDLLFYKMYPSK